MKNLFTILIIPSFLIGGLAKLNHLQGNEMKVQHSSLNKNQIGYLFFKVEKDKSGAEKVTLQDQKISEGKLKFTPTYDRNSANIGDFIITLTNASGKEIVKQSIEDPLNPVMESFEDTIQRTKLSLQNAEFSIRYPHSAEVSMVKVEKITNGGNQLLLTQKL
ncbi:hypothetical protein ABEG63_00200 [Chryseobacterium sp. C39-AII1]|uniref:hypothetical protein n=1 Tax=Chryseobacterium sp. C39-AII1 TaxID=3080332 RepID=UPI00320A17B8